MLHDRKVKRKNQISWERKGLLRRNKKHFFISFKGLSVAKNCLIPESAPLSFPPIRFTVKVCFAFSLFGKPSVEFLGYCWISFSCICSLLFLTDSQSVPQYSCLVLYSVQTSNKDYFIISKRKNFLPFCFKAFQLKNKLCFSTIFFIFFFRKIHDTASEKNICHNSVSTYVETLRFHFVISENSLNASMIYSKSHGKSMNKAHIKIIMENGWKYVHSR